MAKVTVGKKIPSFTATATGGRTISSADMLGRPWILYFYPKDNTPGCTAQGEAFRDEYGKLKRYKVELLGVSRDSLSSHERFKEKYTLPFDLISDPDETLCRMFDVIKEKNMYGRKVMGIERSTFLIDAEGVLRREWRKVKVPGHAEEVLQAVRSLGGTSG